MDHPLAKCPADPEIESHKGTEVLEPINSINKTTNIAAPSNPMLTSLMTTTEFNRAPIKLEETMVLREPTIKSAAASQEETTKTLQPPLIPLEEPQEETWDIMVMFK